MKPTKNQHFEMHWSRVCLSIILYSTLRTVASSTIKHCNYMQNVLEYRLPLYKQSLNFDILRSNKKESFRSINTRSTYLRILARPVTGNPLECAESISQGSIRLNEATDRGILANCIQDKEMTNSTQRLSPNHESCLSVCGCQLTLF